MIDKRYVPYLTALFMALTMGLMMSFVMTAINVGLQHDFLIKWAKAFCSGVLIGLPTAIVVSPYIQKLVNFITK